MSPPTHPLGSGHAALRVARCAPSLLALATHAALPGWLARVVPGAPAPAPTTPRRFLIPQMENLLRPKSPAWLRPPSCRPLWCWTLRAPLQGTWGRRRRGPAARTSDRVPTRVAPSLPLVAAASPTSQTCSSRTPASGCTPTWRPLLTRPRRGKTWSCCARRRRLMRQRGQQWCPSRSLARGGRPSSPRAWPTARRRWPRIARPPPSRRCRATSGTAGLQAGR